jgi:hypothetical protein
VIFLILTKEKAAQVEQLLQDRVCIALPSAREIMRVPPLDTPAAVICGRDERRAPLGAKPKKITNTELGERKRCQRNREVATPYSLRHF